MTQDSGGNGTTGNGAVEYGHIEDPSPSAGLKRLLIVEGDGFTRLLLLRWFRTVGFQVDFTSNGELGWRKLTAQHPDALVLDIRLRGITGLELIRKARRFEGFGDRPIYVFTRPDDLSRSEKKQLTAGQVRLYDRSMITVEKLVAHVLSELVPTTPAAENLASETAVETAPAPKAVQPPVQKAQPVPAATVPGEVPAPAHKAAASELLAQTLGAACAQAQMVLSCTEPRTRVASCGVLRVKLQAFIRSALGAGRHDAARQAGALERFLEYLYMRPECLHAAALETVHDTMDVLSFLATHSFGEEDKPAPYNIVLLDQWTNAGKALSETLQKAGFNPTTINEPETARQKLQKSDADLVISTLEAPELHRLDENAIHELPALKHTPVLQFHPPVNDASPPSSADAGQEATNPVAIMELVLKALNLLQRPSKTEKPTEQGSLPAAAPVQIAAPAEPQALGGQPESSDITAEAAAEQSTALPADVESQIQAAPGEHGSAADQPPTKVLFVEDDPFIVKLYRKRLKAQGYEVDIAEDGAVALEKLPQFKPDVVVLDLMLPRVQGIEVLKFIRSNAELERTPVLVLSNAFMDNLAAKALQAGATQGILKTQCTPARLIAIVEQLLGRAHGDAVVPAQAGTGHLFPGDNGETAVWLRQNDPVVKAPTDIAKIREACLEFIKGAGSPTSSDQLEKLYRGVRFLSARAGLSGLTKVAEMASALEALLFDLVFRSSEPSPSTLQSVAQAVDCLARLISTGDTKFVEPRSKPSVLVVDDDAVCTFTTLAALKRAGFEAVGVQDSQEGLNVLNSRLFDLIILDINMPGLNGFELCERLRQMPQHKTCPVMFVTISAEFQNRARSVLAGGNDLLPKPVNAMELVLKATMHVIKSSKPAVEGGKTRKEESLTTVAMWKVEHIKPEAAAEGGITESERTVPDQADSAQTQQRGVMPEADIPDMFVRRDLTVEPAAPLVAGARPEGDAEAEAALVAATTPDEATMEAAASPTDATDAASSDLVASQPGQEDELGMLKQQLVAQQQALEKHLQEREELVNRVYTVENDLYREQSRIKRRDKTIEALQQEVETLKGNDSREGTQELEAELAKRREESQRRTAELEQENAGLKKAKDELQAGLTKEQESAAAVAKRAQELEQRARQTAAELEKSLKALATHTKERAQAEAELKQQLQAAATARKEQEERCSRLERQVGELASTRDDLQKRLTEEQRAAAHAANEIGQLKHQLDQAKSELQQSQATHAAQAKERAQLETTFNQQLQAATAAQKQEQERCTDLDRQVAELKQARQDLEAKFGNEQQSAAASAKRVKELESELKQATNELHQAQANLEARTKDRTQLETTLTQQLQAATAAQKQEQKRCADLERQLGGLNQAREELQKQFEQEHKTASASAKRIQELEQSLKKATTDLQQANTARETHSKEQSQREASLQQQLQAATTAQQQEQKHAAELDRQLGELKHAREELQARFEKEKQNASKRVQELEQNLKKLAEELNQARANIELRAKDRTELEDSLNQRLEAATTAHKQERKRCADLEHQLSGLNKAREELQKRFTQQEESGAASAIRVSELEKQLKQTTTDLQQAQTTLEARAKDRTQLETTLNQQLQAATTAHKQEQKRCADLERQLGELSKTRETLQQQFAQEQRSAAASANQVSKLESQLKQAAADLQQAQSTLEARAKDRTQLENSLNQQLQASTAAHQQEQKRCAELESQLGQLKQAREELQKQFAHEQQAGVASAKRVGELEKQLKQISTDLQQAQATLEVRAKDRTQLETSLNQQLQAATTARQQEQKRCAELDSQLGQLKQAREQLQKQLEHEQQSRAASARSVKRLEQQLKHTRAELEQAQTTLEAGLKDRSQLEKSLNQQLQAATSAHKQEQKRCAELERQLSEQSKAREELQTQFAQEQQARAVSVKCLQDLEQQFKQAQATLEARAREHQAAEATLNQKLQSVTSAHQEKEKRCSELESQVSNLQQARKELQRQFGQEQQAVAASAKRSRELEQRLNESEEALQQARTTLEARAKERTQLETTLNEQLQKALLARMQEQTRCGDLERQLAGLKQAREELQANLGREQQAAVATQKRILELEQQLRKSEDSLQAQATQRQQIEATLTHKLEAATSAHAQEQKRSQNLELQATQASQARDELQARFGEEQKSAAAFARQLAELQKQLQQTTVDLQSQAQSSAAAAQKAGERCGQLQQEIEKARQERTLLEETLAEHQQTIAERAARIKELQSQLAEAKAKAAKLELEDPFGPGFTSLTQVTSELAQERGARERVEKRAEELSTRLVELQQEHSRLLESEHASRIRITELEFRSRELQETADRTALALTHEKTERVQFEEQLGQAKELNTQYRTSLATLQEGRAQFQRTHAAMEACMHQVSGALQETQTKLQTESAERGRLEAALEAAERKTSAATARVQELEFQVKTALASLNNVEEKFEQAAAEREQMRQNLRTAQTTLDSNEEIMRAETSKLDAALHVERAERKRLETHLMNLRQATVDASRSCRAERNGLRRQFQAPVLRLFDTTRQFLALEHNEEQKRVAETILRDVLVLQTALQEPAPRGTEAANGEKAVETDASAQGS